MGRTIASLLACMSLTVSSASFAADDIRLAPAPGSNWQVDYGEEKCRLFREFGDAEKPNAVVFEQFTPGPAVSLTVAGPDIRPFAEGREIEIRFGPLQGEPVKAAPLGANLGDYGQAIFLSTILLDAADADEGSTKSRFDVNGLPGLGPVTRKTIEWLEITRRGNKLVLDLPQMNDALKVLDHCSQNFLEYWGLDVDEHQSMTRMAEPINFEEIVREVQRKYSSAARRRGEQATLGLRIIVDADGSIEECAISDITVAKYIKSNACEAFGDRAMFAPAEDAAGNPMKSYYSTKIVYRIRQ